MNNNEIKAALAALEEVTFFLIEEYEENGGEVTGIIPQNIFLDNFVLKNDLI